MKGFLFWCHFVGIWVVTFGWILYPPIRYIHPFVILSWWFNDNHCIISQWELKIWGKTFQDKTSDLKVPIHWRYLLYINFLISFWTV